jgi:glycosyltransferase involved in cell wall biosynthesis
MPKVSVIVPVYNAGNKLNKCIKSIINQTFKDFELILVNDGSTDNSWDVCTKYGVKDERIIGISKWNEGSIKARQTGLEVASADYVMFVDADDWVDKTIIKKLYDDAIHYNADVTVCNITKVVGNLGLIKQVQNNEYFVDEHYPSSFGRLYTGNNVKDDLVAAYLHGHCFPSSLCAKLYKKELLIGSGKFLSNIRFLGDDLFYNMEVLLKSKRVKMVNESLYFYRAGGFTSKYMPYLFDDMVGGYKVQKHVIVNHFPYAMQEHMNGASIMLLNTFKTCLYNLFTSRIDTQKRVDMIRLYLENPSVQECLDNEGCNKYFDAEFLKAIKNKDVYSLYFMGLEMYKKRELKRIAMTVASILI